MKHTDNIRRRTFLQTGAAAVAAIAGGSALSACASGGPSGSSSPGNATRSSIKGASITVYDDANPQGQALHQLVPEFEKEYGVTVNHQVISELLITDKAEAAFVAGNGAVDVCWSSLSALPGWATAGWLEPLDSYLSDKSLIGSFSTSDMIAKPFQACQWLGQQYGVPTTFYSNGGLFYRKDILDPLHISPPRTNEEFLDACKTIKGAVNGVYATALRGERGVNTNIWEYNNFLYSVGGTYYKGQPPGGPVPKGAVVAAVNTPDDIAGLELYATFFLDGYTPPGAANWSYPEINTAINSGKVAMSLGDLTFASSYIAALGDKLGYAFPPVGPKGLYPGFDAQMYTIAKSSSQKAAATAFIAWATSPAVQVQTAKLGKYVAVTSSSALSTLEAAQILPVEYISVFKQVLPYLDINHYPITPSFTTVGEDVSIAVSAAISGQQSATAALNAAQAQANSYLSEHPSTQP
jgi:multiple sugar transport system substrate-binding protein